MPRYSKPSAYPRSIEVLGEHGLDPVAVMQRGASIGHDDLALVEALENFRGVVVSEPDPHPSRFHNIPFDHLNGQLVNGGSGNRDAATALGVDAGAGEQAALERAVVGQRYPDMAGLGGAMVHAINQRQLPPSV